MKTLFSISEVTEKINANKKLFLAADEALLKQLPKGNWIAGTIPYFMSMEEGGVFRTDSIFVNELPDYVISSKIQSYDETSLPKIAIDEYNNGFSLIIIPGFSNIHLSFAKNAMDYEGIFNNPILGWISGIALQDIGKVAPKVFDGATGIASETHAVVMHIQLPEHLSAKVDIINLFKQGTGDILTFPTTDFSATKCFVNGAERNFAEYIITNKIDTKLPLTADMCGAIINTSFQAVDEKEGKVLFYAPVFEGMEYRIAAPVTNYVTEFEKRLNENPISPLFTCNCILNYLFGELEGKKTGKITGPITFGEIAYQLLNQTMVFLTIE